MWVGYEMDKIKKDPTVIKCLFLPSINLKVNLYSSVVQSSNGGFKTIKKAASNNRDQRVRPESS